MKIQLILFFCLTITFQLFSQDIREIAALERQADTLYYNLSELRDEKSYILENKIRKVILAKYTDTLSEAYKMSLTKKYASEARYLLAHKKDHKAAIVVSKKALDILETLKKKNLVFKGHIYHFLYQQYWHDNDLVKALSTIKKSRSVFMDTLVANHKLVADAEFNIGYVSGPIGDMDTAMKQFKIAIDKYTSFLGKNSFDVAEKLMHLATVYGFIGYYKKELDAYLESIEIWEAIDHPDKSYQAIAYGNVSTWYLWHGDFEKAEQYLIKHEDLIDKHKKEGEPWYNETFLGRTKLALLRKYAALNYYKGNLGKALKINNEVLDSLLNYDINDSNNDPNNFGVHTINSWVKFQTIRALRFKADIIKETNPDGAKALHERALQIRNQNTLTESPLEDLMYLSNYYLEKEDLDNAKKIVNKSIAESKERTDEYALIQLYAKKAEIAERQDSVTLMKATYKKVFRLLQKDFEEDIAISNLNYGNCKPYGDVRIINITIEAADNYASLFKKRSDTSYLKDAYNLSTLASDMFTQNNRDFKYNDKSYTTISKINEGLLSTGLLYRGKKSLNHALEKIEQSKSHQVWKAFLSSKERKNLNVPDSILEKEKNLKAELHYYKKSLFIDNKGDSLKNNIWNEKILDIENAIDIVDLWYQKKYPAYYNQTKKKFDVQSLQSKLTKNQLLINYVFATNYVYAFTISKNEIDLFRIGKKEKVEKEVRDFLNGLKDKTDAKYFEIGHTLYQKLLPELINRNKNKELIIVPDDVLHYLPFEILINEKGAYLIQNKTVSYAPSLLLYREQMEVRTSKKNKLGVFTPSYLDSKNDKPDRDALSELKGAFSEGQTISKLFNGDFFDGKNLSKKVFMNNAKAYNILHLAMHASLNNVSSEFSNLDFSSENKSDKLFISELYGINVNADLAVLSACNTGVGILKKGEGITNVARAFTYAGVPSTVTSLWRVPDRQTAQIMVSFYEYLKEGLSKNVALQKAKLDYLNTTEDELLKHPYYWAGFVVSGNVEPLQGSNSLQWWVLLLVLFFGICIWLLRRKPQSN
jgi:CHAT domain-containing protein